MAKFLFTILLSSTIIFLQAQDISKITIDESYNGVSLTEMVEDLEEAYNVDIIYNKGSIEGYTVFGVQKNYKLLDFLNLFLVGFTAKEINDRVAIVIQKHYLEAVSNLKHDYVIVKGNPINAAILKGTVLDAGNDEPIAGANIYIPEIKKGEVTDRNGAFSISVSKNVFLLEIQYIGYDTQSIIVGLSPLGEKASLSTVLFESSTQLAGVEIMGERQDRNISQQVTGIEKMGIESIKKLPTFMGEVDPLKSLTTLPGISTSGDVTAGINVRGGDTGQNFIFQDDAIIYNPTHLFGFFSAFNPDMVKDVTLYKGGGPANFGGRVSSVLDIGLKNGDMEKHTVKGGIGLISSRLSAEGPVSRKNSSYLVGARFSYSDWLINSVDNIQLKNSSAQFYDITGKFFQKINEKNFISVSGYYSYDAFNLATDSTFSWNTKNISLKWDHTFGPQAHSEFTVASSNYSSNVINKDEISSSKYENGINTLSTKYSLNLNQLGENKYQVGIESAYSGIDPGTQNPLNNESTTEEIDLLSQNVLETSLYAQGEFEINPKLAITTGLRYSTFFRFGEDVIYDYNENVIVGRTPEITDTTYYQKGELISNYNGIEPRMSLRYVLNDNTSLKTSYYRTYQYLHLISNTTIPMPQDYWIASSDNFQPQIGDQFSLGIFKNFADIKYEMSVEGYYKTISNTVDYIEGSDVTLNQAIETSLVQGTGLSYGVEFLLRKNTGAFNGWIAYTYSRSLRKFDMDNSDLKINQGTYYPSIYDQPHNLSLVLNYYFNKRTILSANFQYNTGRPITIPTSKYSYDSYLSVLNYSDRNEFRMPDYHRLDLSLTIKDRKYKDRLITGEWIFSIYNVYGRKNAYSIFFDTTGLAYKMSVLGSIFPSISYNFKL